MSQVLDPKMSVSKAKALITKLRVPTSETVEDIQSRASVQIIDGAFSLEPGYESGGKKPFTIATKDIHGQAKCRLILKLFSESGTFTVPHQMSSFVVGSCSSRSKHAKANSPKQLDHESNSRTSHVAPCGSEV